MNLISSVYNNENRIPVNFEAVKEFFLDHEYVVDQTIRRTGKPGLINLELFKKPTDSSRPFIYINSEINIQDYIRVGMSLKRLKQNRPYKLRKLRNLIGHFIKREGKKRPYITLLINELVEQNVIKIEGETVLYWDDIQHD